MSLLESVTQATQAARAAQQLDPEAANLARLQYQEQLAKAQGFSLPPTWYPVGTKLIQAGTDKARLLRQQWEQLPTLEDAAAQLSERIAVERRRDVEVPLSTLEVDPATGRLHRKGNGRAGLLLTATGWSQLLSWLNAPRYAAAYLRQIPTERRSVELAHILALAPERDVVLRTRMPRPDLTDDVEVYAVVSDRYHAANPDAILDVACKVLRGRGMKAEIEYGGPGSTRIRAVGHSNVAPSDFRVGEVFRAAVSIASADDRTGGLETAGEVIRGICINLTSASAFGGTWHGRHSSARLEQELADAIRKAGTAIGPFLAMWDRRSRETLPDGVDGAAVLRAMVADLRHIEADALISVPNVSTVQLGDYLVDAYNVEPERTVAGVANALTRAPQLGAWPDPLDAQNLLAQAAGRVVKDGLEDALELLYADREAARS